MNNQWRNHSERIVVWGDGTYDTSRSCNECGSLVCKSPVHSDHYKEIGTTVLETREAEQGLNYWAWTHSNQPGKRDHDGEIVSTENIFANPDGLAANALRVSGVEEEQHALAQEAFEQLTDKQKEVWQLIMRDQCSQTDAAIRLNITQQAIEKHLRYAKAKYTEYLRSKQEC